MIMPSNGDGEEHKCDSWVQVYHPMAGVMLIPEYVMTTWSGSYELKEDGVYYNKDVEEKTNKKPRKETQRWWKWLEEAHTKGLI